MSQLCGLIGQHGEGYQMSRVSYFTGIHWIPERRGFSFSFQSMGLDAIYVYHISNFPLKSSEKWVPASARLHIAVAFKYGCHNPGSYPFSYTQPSPYTYPSSIHMANQRLKLVTVSPRKLLYLRFPLVTRCVFALNCRLTERRGFNL